MNEKKITTYYQIKNEALTTSQVIQSSFSNVFQKIKKYEYAIVNNHRKKMTLIITTVDKYLKSSEISSGKLNVSKREKLKIIIKNQIKENVFYLMRFESQNITFPEIEAIVDRAKLETKYDFDVQLTKQLVKAWEFILKTIETCDFYFLLRLNSIIAQNQALEWGVLRKGKVTISGTEFIPSIPSKRSINQILNIVEKDPIKKACLMLVRLIKQQPFWDGNKRTAFLYVNKFLLDKVKGSLVVSEKNLLQFHKLLNAYYEDERKEVDLIIFLQQKCFKPLF